MLVTGFIPKSASSSSVQIRGSDAPQAASTTIILRTIINITVNNNTQKITLVKSLDIFFVPEITWENFKNFTMGNHFQIPHLIEAKKCPVQLEW